MPFLELIVNRLPLWLGVLLLLGVVVTTSSCGDSRSGPEKTETTPQPVTDNKKDIPVASKPNLKGVHPRLFLSEAELQQLARAYQADPQAMGRFLPKPDGEEMTKVPTVFPIKEWDGQGNILSPWAWIEASALASLANAYRITGDAQYLERFKLWLAVLPASLPIEIPHLFEGNRDLSVGPMLLGLASAYDLLKGHVDAETEKALRGALTLQAGQTYRDLKALKHFPYEQNHFFIPLNALIVAAAALDDETPEANEWKAWATEMSGKCLEALSRDSWYHEGISYWDFSMLFPTAAAIVLKRTTGEDRFQKPPFRDTDKYLSHQFLPDPKYAFDFADWGPRVEAGGKAFQHGYDKPWHTLTTRVGQFIPYFTWKEQRSPLMQNFLTTVAKKSSTTLGFASLVQMGMPKETPAIAELPPPYHYFSDMEVVHWRNAWDAPDATALAFKSGPPAGHHFAKFIKAHPDAAAALGHPHPDAGSFILFAKGAFLANDTGYAIKKTAYHNTLLVDGIGQHKDGSAWLSFDPSQGAKPYDEYDKIRMTDVWLAPNVMAATAVFDAAYADTLQLQKMNRSLIMINGRFLVVLDEIQSELPHAYTWLLHTDKEPRQIAPNRFVMTNGPAQLAVQNLIPVESSEIAPTIVETELYNPERPRPQQRGFHLALTSAKAKIACFVTAFCVQSSDENESQFQATLQDGNRIVMSDGEQTCTVWIGQGGGLDGNFAYSLHKKGSSTREVGLFGKELRHGDIHLSQPAGKQTVVQQSVRTP